MNMSAAEKLRAKVTPKVGAGDTAKVFQHPTAMEKAKGNVEIDLPNDLLSEVEAEAKQGTQQDVSKKLEQSMGVLKAGVLEDQFGEFNISVVIGRRREVINIESGAGKDAIRQVIQTGTGKLPPKAHIENIQALIRMAARADGKKGLVYQRIAYVDGARLIDLGDPEGHCVRVVPGAWELTQDGTAAFLRGRGYGAHPMPVPSRSPRHAFHIIYEWLLALGVRKSKAALVVVALVAWLRTGNTYPILLLYGPPGSGKTVAAKLILMLIDPTESGALPNIGMDTEHIGAAAQHRHILSFDNLSKLSAANQDTLCTCSTGGEIVGRRLYSNGDIAVLPIHRPVLMTAVQPVITRPDLLSRAIPIEFSQRETRKGENEIMAEFMEVRPGLLGALCDLLAVAEGAS
jgi:hypothetical protein